MTRLTCSRCNDRPAVSSSALLCEACLYADTMGRERAEQQVAAARAESEKRKQARREKARG